MRDYIYYTPKDLALKIMELIDDKPYDNVIDICCGSWNLLRAAKEKLKCCHLTGVDVDQNMLQYKTAKDKFYLEDGREYALRCYKKKRYDLVLSNPPFGLLNNDNRIMKDKLTEHKYAPILSKRFENEMLVANMLLVKREGILVAILPQTFVFGISHLKVRKEIAKEFKIDAIIRLPEGTFKKNDIRTCAVILRKSKKNKPTILYNAVHNNEWILNVIETIDDKYINLGYWENNSKHTTKNKLLIYRGTVCSSKLREEGKKKIFHCSSQVKKGVWKPTVKRTDVMCAEKSTEIGDILVNRIGKKAGYWCICNKKGYLVSDCIIVIRNAPLHCIKVLEENSVDGRMNIPIRGVSTQYITENDIQTLLSGI